MDEQEPEVTTRPATALALWISGAEPPPLLMADEDGLGAQIYEKALAAYRHARLTSFPLASHEAVTSTADVYAIAAAVARRAREDALVNNKGTLKQALAELGRTVPEVDSPSLWVVGNALLVEAFRYQVIRDDFTMWTMIESTFAREITGLELIALDELCGLATGRSTPRAYRRWASLHYHILEFMNSVWPEEQSVFDDRLRAIGTFADAVLPGHDPAPIAWITSETMSTLRDLDQFIADGSPAFDTWLGSLLYICDTVVAAGRLDECREILRLAIDVVGRCGPSGPNALRPGQPSRYREDARFLLSILDNAPEDTEQ
ncbi:hypothetical protein Cs7R123_47860 [Catellatospora sp. TT07R-123]|uniref:hypothetical protein n=1 Tax=Catellatospora sp. TT07R-123 TaxID=2733863 RepID=UPI001B1FA318|nr:hypothetical protein [Catellatospora sp. TT07R-123]GHJ47444.1 hypothetical protein Cs7R123_47860 [Catellatospora sp. TT07R-123]